MSRRIDRRFMLVLAALGLFGLLPAAAEEADADEQALRAENVATDGPGLLAFLRGRTLGDEDDARLKALVRQLGSDSFAQREKATAALLRYGRLALPYLRQGAADADVEVARRSRRCIEAAEADAGPALTLAALHLVARRRPEGAAEVLLRYLPFADDPFVEGESLAALAAVALRDGRPDPVLVRALEDKIPVRRAGAAYALGRVKDPAARAPVRPLLADPDERVRLEAANALLLAQEKEAVPALIGLLRADSAEVAARAESLLLLAAGGGAPEASAGDGSAAARRKWHDAWADWWRMRGDGLDLSRVGAGEQKLGLVLVAETNGEGGQRVWEYGPDRKERWAIGGGGANPPLNWPMDVRVLPGESVLIADFGTRGVTERDRAGKVLWEKACPDGGALAVQRLPNGHTFICTQQRLLEVDRAGKEVASHAAGHGTLTDGVRLANGNVLFINTRGALVEVGWPTPRQVRTLQLGRGAPQGTDWYRLEPAPGGHLLLASHTDGRVFEIDAAGKVVWEHKVPQAYSATRLANGNVLIATAESRRLIEVTRAGKVVHEGKTRGYGGRVRAR